MSEIIEKRNQNATKTSISVPEMRRMFGLGKTESYWLVKKNYFKTVLAGGKLRIMIDSFEKWYAGQLHYKKVNGPAPGANWTAFTLSIQETADLLGITTSTLYDLLKKKPFKTYAVNNKTRIDLASFEEWYENQTHYKKNT